MPEHRALARVNDYGRRFPFAWKLFANLMQQSPTHMWPSWCWCPLQGAHKVLSVGLGRSTTLDDALDAVILGGLATWRATQGIYRFHPALLRELQSTPITGDIPADVLLRLPEWCVYIETPGFKVCGNELPGFWAHLDCDVGRQNERELRFLLDHPKYECPVPVMIPLCGSLAGAMAKAVEAGEACSLSMGIPLSHCAPEHVERFAQDISKEFGPLVSLVLYLCADEAEIEARGPLPPRVVQGKKRSICPAPKAPIVHLTGMRIGAKLELARARYERSEGQTGESVRPHVRRAHWHHYWTGPREGERRTVLRWLSPILVGYGDDRVPTEAVVRPVPV